MVGDQHSIEPSTEFDVDQELAGSMPTLDMNQRSVLVTGVRSSFVEFEFTVADPMLTVELVMPLSALDEFIHDQRATLEVKAQSQLDFARLRSLTSRSNRQHLLRRTQQWTSYARISYRQSQSQSGRADSALPGGRSEIAPH